MILVDTSVWIRFISGRDPQSSQLDDLLEQEDVLGHDLVFGELLMGDSGSRSNLLNAYLALPKAQNVPHAEVVAFTAVRKLNGSGIGWIDTHLLASALVTRSPLWTADERLHRVASDLGIARTALQF